jgi:hypothetical protein
MTMRCKEGDMAIIESVPVTDPPAFARALERAAVGLVVRCVRLTPPTAGSGPTWRIEPPFVVPWLGTEITFYGVADANLRPIRGASIASDAEPAVHGSLIAEAA